MQGVLGFYSIGETPKSAAMKTAEETEGEDSSRYEIWKLGWEKGEGKKDGSHRDRRVWGEMAEFVVDDNSLPVAEAARLEMESPPPARHKRVDGRLKRVCILDEG